MHEFNDYQTIQVRIGDQFYTLWVADTPERKKKGLKGVTQLPRNKGMIFAYSTPQRHNFTMKGVNIPLRIIFIDDKHQVINSELCQPGKEKVIPEDDFMYVIEI